MRSLSAVPHIRAAYKSTSELRTPPYTEGRQLGLNGDLYGEVPLYIRQSPLQCS